MAEEYVHEPIFLSAETQLICIPRNLGCGHTKGKSVVSRSEAYARIHAACDARDNGKDIFVLARTDALIHGWDEAISRAKEFKRIGVDAVFVEALPDKDAMRLCVEEVGIPTFANSASTPSPSLRYHVRRSCCKA